MRSVGPMKTAKNGYILISAVLCVLGLLLICMPQFSEAFIGTVCAVVLIAFGIVKLIGYFSKDLYRLAFQYDLAFGVLLMVIGAALLARPEGLANFICLILGLMILADGLLKIQIALDSKRFGLNRWWMIFAAAIVTCVFGALLLFRPTESAEAVTILLGIAMLAEGVLNLCTAITAVKIVRNQRPDDPSDDYQ